MKNIVHYLEPRNSGKTTLAKELLLEKVETHEKTSRVSISISNSGRLPKVEDFRGMDFEKIIIDEYLVIYHRYSKRDRQQIFEWLLDQQKRGAEIILLSTPVKMYSPLEVLVADWSWIGRNVVDSRKRSIGEFINEREFDKISEKITEIQQSFLTPSTVEIRQNTLPFISDKNKLPLFTKQELLMNVKAQFVLEDRPRKNDGANKRNKHPYNPTFKL